MKKLFEAILALCLLAAFSVTAFASSAPANENEKTTTVTFNVDPTYTVTIPGTIELKKDTESGKYQGKAEIYAENVRLLEGKQIKVTVSGDFALSTGAKGAEYKLPYTVKVDASDTAITSGAIVATFITMTDKQSVKLHFEADNPTYAGTYTDTVTFTISVE